MLRRLSPIQPDSFEFTPANLDWARAQMTKFPEGRQQSAIIPVLWRAQEQEGWLSRPAIEYCAELLGMAYIRALEVATFYFMFQLHPVGSVANIQICGTTTCMVCGSGDLIAVCKEKIAPQPHTVSADGKFSWEEVECLGACANAPMAQIGKDYYEDLTPEKLAQLIDAMAAHARPAVRALRVQAARAERTYGRRRPSNNAWSPRSWATAQRIDGTEVPILTPWVTSENPEGEDAPVDTPPPPGFDDDDLADVGRRPAALGAARDGNPDDLKQINGVGPKLEELLNSLGFYHFDQIASWSDEEVAWVDANLEGFKGRVTRDGWVEQADRLARSSEGADS